MEIPRTQNGSQPWVKWYRSVFGTTSWKKKRNRSVAWMSGRKLGSMVSKWDISPTYKWGILGWNHPLILTIDPNFQRDIQVTTFLLRLLSDWSSNNRPNWSLLFHLQHDDEGESPGKVVQLTTKSTFSKLNWCESLSNHLHEKHPKKK